MRREDQSGGREPVCVYIQWTKITLKQEADKVVRRLNRFKDVGDVAVNADLAHAGLPWAGIRLLLGLCPGLKDSIHNTKNRHHRSVRFPGHRRPFALAVCLPSCPWVRWFEGYAQDHMSWVPSSLESQLLAV